jgi:hypothetical protein
MEYAGTITAVKEAGYVGAVTENAGYASRERPYEPHRYEIGNGVEGSRPAFDPGARGRVTPRRSAWRDRRGVRLGGRLSRIAT